MKYISLSKGSTLILKLTVLFIGLAVAVVCATLLPLAIRAELRGDFDYGLIFAGLYLPAIPFFIAIYQALKLLEQIEDNNVFTIAAVEALKRIKYCGFAISGLFVLGMPYIFYLGDKDDAPGVVALGLVLIGASFVVGTAAAVFQKMLQSAVDLKSENDLTV